MYLVMNRFFVKPEYADRRNRPQRVDRQQGFIRIQILRPANPGDPYIVLTVWETKANFQNWATADSFTEKHAGGRTLPGDIFRAPNRVETFELILDTAATP